MLRARNGSRRTAGAALLAVIVVLAGCDWSQSRFGPEHTGFNPGETTIGSTSIAGLSVRWSAPQGSGSAPAIADGAAYVSSGKLYSFDASTGSARWVSAIRSESSPAVDGGLVYVAGLKDGSSWLYALDAGSGIERWSQNVGERWPTSPTVIGGVVYVTGEMLYAFDATTGARRWSAVSDEGFLGSPTVANGIAYVGGDKLYAFDATTGTRLWAVGGPISNFSSPSVANSVVYVGNPVQLFAFDARTGTQRWSTAAGVEPSQAPAVANGVVYVGAQRLVAIDAATGARLWSAGTTSEYYLTPAVANGLVYVGSAERFFVFSAATGAQLSSLDLRNGSAAVAHGVLYVTSAQGVSAYAPPRSGPQLRISPSFPEAFVFGTPGATSRTFTVTNLGTTPTSPITDGLSGPDWVHFRQVSDGCAGIILAGRASCTVTVSFTPTRSGPRTAWLTATATTGGVVRTLLTATAQPFTLSPPSQYFGDLFEGATSSAAFTVTNLTDKPVGQVTNSITPSGGLSLFNDLCAGRLIAPAASCTFSVRFAPTAGVTYAASLSAQVPGYESRASLAGRGLSRLAIAPASKNFGPLAPGTSGSASFTVTNISPATVVPITDSLVYVYGPDGFTITSDTCAGRSLSPNASCAVVVTYAPVTYGFRQAQLRTAAPLAGSAMSALQGGI